MAQVTVQIADKATLDTVNTNTASTKTTVESTATDVTTLKGRGGIKYNSTTSKPQVYDTTNSTWVDLEVGGGGGGASPTLIVRNKAHSMDNVDITVYDQYFTLTKNMGTNTYISFELPYLGEFTVTYIDVEGNIKTQTIAVENVGGVILDAVNFPSFATATDIQIANMLDLHYQDEFDLSTIWSIGDTRDIDISAMSATGVGESHSAQTRQIAIIDFNHDDLQTSINGHTKAAVTVQLVDSLDTAGYMNSSSTNVGGWTNSARRTWCNDVFYNALPSVWKTMVKTVQKKTSAGNQSSTINTDNDKTFFLSEIEVFNSNTYAKSGEGTQYPYYTIAANRIKKRSGSAYYWWLRSPYGSNSTYFVFVASDGSVGNYYASNAYGLAPALCI